MRWKAGAGAMAAMIFRALPGMDRPQPAGRFERQGHGSIVVAQRP
jgi:hypothetical protein